MAQHEVDCGNYRLTRADSSGHKCVSVPTKRVLTSGEIAMARTMFKGSIDYSKVLICKGSLFHNVTGNARTIGYEIVLPVEDYNSIKDFSSSDKYLQIWFIHEMAHVWQHVLGVSTVFEGACLLLTLRYTGHGVIQNRIAVRKPLAYGYNIYEDKKFEDYQIEQQAEIICHYFEILKFGTGAQFYSFKSDYETVLRKFILNPSDKSILGL